MKFHWNSMKKKGPLNEMNALRNLVSGEWGGGVGEPEFFFITFQQHTLSDILCMLVCRHHSPPKLVPSDSSDCYPPLKLTVRWTSSRVDVILWQLALVPLVITRPGLDSVCVELLPTNKTRAQHTLRGLETRDWMLHSYSRLSKTWPPSFCVLMQV